jgi:hypothetical protein
LKPELIQEEAEKLLAEKILVGSAQPGPWFFGGVFVGLSRGKAGLFAMCRLPPLPHLYTHNTNEEDENVCAPADQSKNLVWCQI